MEEILSKQLPQNHPRQAIPVAHGQPVLVPELLDFALHMMSKR